ncbi:MAG: Polyribonucleotide nucleotidyltransferase [Eubacteriales bacterium SKADARSKE-1]|nr:Polyribonucleotide nucleotidyltransferase [Eubacteriales bacterium SKADARSKE-1]
MQLKVGEIVEGKVTKITNFGAFVEIMPGKSGMIYISEISTNFVKNINDYLKEGQIVKTKIINISEKGEVALSIRRLENNNKQRPDFKGAPRANNRHGWQNTKKEPTKSSFEDMLSMFKTRSEEKMSDLKRVTESKRGGYSRRGSQNKAK